MGNGVYLTSDPRIAETYANLKGGYQDQQIMPLYAAVRNPFHADLQTKQYLRKLSKKGVAKWTQDLKNRGFDGVVLDFPDGTMELVAFDPLQVKSSVGNSGEFSPENPSILRQGEEQAKRGQYIPDEQRIRLLEKADLSTFVHESGHFFLDTYTRIASGENAPAKVCRMAHPKRRIGSRRQSGSDRRS